MILYLHKKCSTCQKALRFLDSKNLKVEIIDITLQAPSVAELKMMLAFQKGNLKKLFNTSGLLYREMGLSQTNLSQTEILELLSCHGMLVKRPFLLGEDFALLGFKETEWTQLFLNREVQA